MFAEPEMFMQEGGGGGGNPGLESQDLKLGGALQFGGLLAPIKTADQCLDGIYLDTSGPGRYKRCFLGTVCADKVMARDTRELSFYPAGGPKIHREAYGLQFQASFWTCSTSSSAFVLQSERA